ncbi:MAG: DapH/DapD/GlmU-related protein, partial [Oscillospiraceae bacterium]
IGVDTLILPGTIIKGKTTIGRENTIGANSCISNSYIGNGNVIEQTKISDSTVGDGCKIGPFTQLRPNSKIGNYVKIGNFVEVKNSSVGEKTSLAHLTYIGDSDFGRHINVGCGVVTVNYNGVGKFRTTVEDDAFIGCNSNLIAPVRVKKGAYVAAASTITSDVSENALAIGRVKIAEKENGALKYRKK